MTVRVVWPRIVVLLGALGAVALGERALRGLPEPVPARPRKLAADELVRVADAVSEEASRAENGLRDGIALLTLTDAQRAALVETGQAIKQGEEPMRVLAPELRARIGEIETTVRKITCTPPVPAARCAAYQLDLGHCVDEAAKVVGLWIRDRASVDDTLFAAAHGVSVVTRERENQSVLNLIDFCGTFLTLSSASRRS